MIKPVYTNVQHAQQGPHVLLALQTHLGHIQHLIHNVTVIQDIMTKDLQIQYVVLATTNVLLV